MRLIIALLAVLFYSCGDTGFDPVEDCNAMKAWMDAKGAACFDDWGETEEFTDTILCEEVIGITDRGELYWDCRFAIKEMSCFDYAFINA